MTDADQVLGSSCELEHDEYDAVCAFKEEALSYEDATEARQGQEVTHKADFEAGVATAVTHICVSLNSKARGFRVYDQLRKPQKNA